MTFDPFRLQRKSVFRYPMDPAPRTTVLAACLRPAGFLAKSTIRLFPQGWSEEVAAFAPAAVAATREELLGLAAADRPPAFTHAVIVLERPGQMLSAECEAHDGLHIEVPGMAWNGYRLESAPCGCGRTTPRLAPREAVERLRSTAAYAR